MVDYIVYTDQFETLHHRSPEYTNFMHLKRKEVFQLVYFYIIAYICFTVVITLLVPNWFSLILK